MDSVFLLLFLVCWGNVLLPNRKRFSSYPIVDAVEGECPFTFLVCFRLLLSFVIMSRYVAQVRPKLLGSCNPPASLPKQTGLEGLATMPGPFYYCFLPPPQKKIWSLRAVAQSKWSVCKTEGLGCYTNQPRPRCRHRPGFLWKGKRSDEELPAATAVPGANIVTKAGSVPCLGRLKSQLKPL